jgi:O-antigen ligase/O-antigen/teichoic acid export membrane protein
MIGAVRPLVRRLQGAAGASAAQLAQALTSLVLQVAAARALGADGLGVFALLYGLIILATAITTGLVGDSLTVLDRADARVRAGLIAVGLAVAAITACGAAGVVSVSDLVTTRQALLFGLGAAVFVLEELLRRLLMASLRFWSVVVVDTTCLVVTLGGLAARAAVAPIGLTQLLGVLVLAQVAGLVMAVVLLPSSERWFPSMRRPDVGSVVRFGRWRAAQQAIRPTTMTAMRSLVILAAGTAAFGELEGARVYTAPALLVVNGIGGFLFASYAADRHLPMPALIRRADLGAAFLAGGVMLAGLAALVILPWASGLVTSGDFTIHPVAVFGWMLYAAATGLVMPYGGLASVSGQHVKVFGIRLGEAMASCLGIALLLGLGGSASWVPGVLAAGAALSAVVNRQTVKAHPTLPAEAETPEPARDERPIRPVRPVRPVAAVPLRAVTASGLPRRKPLPGYASTPEPDHGRAPGSAPDHRVPDRAPARTTAVAPRRVSPWWFPICVLALILATDYNFRVRDPRATLSAGVDFAVLIEICVYGLVAAHLVLAHGRPPRVRRTQPVIYFACLYGFLMVLSVAYTTYPPLGLVRAVQMCVVLGLVLTAARSATLDDMHRLAHAYLVLVAASVLYGIVVPSRPLNPLVVGRFTWLAIHPTTSGVLVGLATVIAVAYATSHDARARGGPVWPRWAYVGLLVLVGGGLIATRTRGAVLGAVVAIVLVLVTRQRGRELVRFAGAALVVGIGLALAAGTNVVTYFERGESAEKLATLNSRTDLWETAIAAIEKRPLFGYGVTSARGIFYEEIGLGGGHNAVVNVLVELGLVGLTTWLVLVGLLIGVVRRLPVRLVPRLRFDRSLLLGLLAFLVVDGLFFEGPGAPANVASTWFFVCLAWACTARRTAATSPPPRIPTEPDRQAVGSAR